MCDSANNSGNFTRLCCGIALTTYTCDLTGYSRHLPCAPNKIAYLTRAFVESSYVYASWCLSRKIAHVMWTYDTARFHCNLKRSCHKFVDTMRAYWNRFVSPYCHILHINHATRYQWNLVWLCYEVSTQCTHLHPVNNQSFSRPAMTCKCPWLTYHQFA